MSFLTIHPGPEEPLGVLVHEMNVTTFHSPGQQHPIGVFNEVYKLVLRPFHNGVLGAFLMTDPNVMVEVIP